MIMFWELAKRAFQRQLSYRAATLAGLFTNFFFGLLRIALMVALYGELQEVEGVTLAGAITYTGLSQATIGYLSMFSWFPVMNSIHSGEVGSDLLKPMNYFTFWLAQDAGRTAASFLMRGMTMMAGYALFIGIIAPPDTLSWLALLPAILLSWLVSFGWRFLVNLPAFWTPNALGIGRFFFIISWFFSGQLMPLRFFPEWVQTIAKWTPFPHTVNTVVEVYLGVLTPGEVVGAIASQAAWFIVLVIMGQLVLRAGVRRLVILGG